MIYPQVIDAIAEEVGYDRHDKAGKNGSMRGCVFMPWGTAIDPISKREVRKFHTSKASVQQMSDYIEWIPRFMADEYHVVIVLPGEM